MIKFIAIAVLSAGLASLLTGYLTYTSTRAKWHDLGHQSGLISGRAEVMMDLAKYAQKGAPPAAANYTLNVKANRLSVLKTGTGVRMYFE